MELIGVEDADTPRTAAKKKRSTLSRLAERRKKGSDGESDYGSKASLGLHGNNDDHLSTSLTLDSARPTVTPRFSSSPRYGGAIGTDDTDSRNISHSKSYDNSGITPIEYSGGGVHTGASLTASQHTLEKFQSLNVEPSSSFDLKGEKRNHEQNSSGEDVDPETGHVRKLTAGESVGVSDLRYNHSSPRPVSQNNRDFNYSSAAASAAHAAGAEGMEIDNDSDDSGNVDFGETNNEILGMLEQHEKAEAGTPDPFKQYMERKNDFEEDNETREVHDQYRHLLTSTPTKDASPDKGARPWSAETESSDSLSMPVNKGQAAPVRPGFHMSMTTPNFGTETMDTTFSKTSRMLRASSQTRFAGQALDSMSQNSYTTTCSLPPISTKTARERSFLVGSINSNSLLGTDELQRCFPDRKMKVYVATWNVAEKSPKDLPKLLNDFLLPETLDFMPDLCVIGTQESCTDRKEWEIRLQETLGPSHVLYHSANHGSLMLCAFIRRDLIWFCSVPEDDHLSTRTAVRTKGSLGISFTVFGTSFLFINSHFKSDDGKLKERLEDYNKSIAGLNLPKSTNQIWHGSKANDVTARFDAVFWNGDLNFRIERERQIVDRVMAAIKAKQHPNYEDLLLGDELLKCRNEGKAFAKFLEGRINFAPTYKFDLGHDDYDTSPTLRIPSYCDRILFRSRKKHGIVCHHYDSVESMKASDHRPVYGLYEVDIRPGRDNIPLAAGSFNREVYLEATNRRAQHLEPEPVPLQKTQKSSKVCSIQ